MIIKISVELFSFSFLYLSVMLRNSLHGVFSVYKPKGWYSREATNYVQHALSNEILGREKSNTRFKRKELIKIGHGGTLVILILFPFFLY